MESRIKIILHNNFHNTSVNVFEHFVHDGNYPYAYLTAKQVKRCRGTLCGIKECTCSNDLGERPSGVWEYDPTTGSARKYIDQEY